MHSLDAVQCVLHSNPRDAIRVVGDNCCRRGLASEDPDAAIKGTLGAILDAAGGGHRGQEGGGK